VQIDFLVLQLVDQFAQLLDSLFTANKELNSARIANKIRFAILAGPLFQVAATQ
jgi:hypothetical protein